MKASLYYFTGDQLEIANFQDCEDGMKKDAVWQMAGAEILSLAGFSNSVARTASIYLKCPWNSISALQKPLPLPTDLLTQPVQLVIETNRASDVFYNIGGTALLSDLPTQFASAQIQYKQVHMTDAGHQLARTHDMNSESLTYPLPYFQQTTFRTTVNTAAYSDVNINLTGFRAGSVKRINLWALQTKDASGVAVNGAGNLRNYSQFASVRVSVNGLVYYDSRDFSNQLWDMCELKVPGNFNNTILSNSVTPGTAVATPVATPWVRIPFAQVAEILANETNTTLGLAISNSVVNLVCQFPAGGEYVISASYEYVSELMFTRGSCEYVF